MEARAGITVLLLLTASGLPAMSVAEPSHRSPETGLASPPSPTTGTQDGSPSLVQALHDHSPGTQSSEALRTHLAEGLADYRDAAPDAGEAASTNPDLARDLLLASPTEGWEGALETSRLVPEARTPSNETPSATPAPDQAGPGRLASQLATLYGLESPGLHHLGELETLSGDLRDPLATILEASMEMTQASRGLADSSASVAQARLQLLDAADDLHDDSPDRGSTSTSKAPPVLRLPPLIAVDPTGTNTTYTHDYLVQVDVGGNDTYHNNAGGSNVSGLPTDHSTAGVLVDLAGDDTYGNASNLRSDGVNGGGKRGVGNLVDIQGNDTYVAGHGGVNGGGSNPLQEGGSGFLVDGSGDDRYHADDSGGVNGGANGPGAQGLLVDGGGNDTYVADGVGSNGGASVGGRGALVDLGGDDRYGTNASWGGVNGGAFRNQARGFLADMGGDDEYRASGVGVNGGGDRGAGFLLDTEGNDSYSGDSRGVNGGAIFSGTGALLDLEGNDAHLAVGQAGDEGVNGGAAWGGTGLLVSLGSGDDRYNASGEVQGFLGGQGGQGANGGVFGSGNGRLIDEGGDDRYYVNHERGANGQAYGSLPANGAALLWDGGGHDRYEDPDLECWDCSRVPRGTVGALVDAEDSSR